MNVYTLQPGVIQPTQAIRDALNLPADTSHVRWLIAAPNHNWVVYLLRGRGWPNMPTTQTGIHLSGGRDVAALADAGLLANRTVLVTADNPIGAWPIAVVDKGGLPRRIGMLDQELTDVRYIPGGDRG